MTQAPAPDDLHPVERADVEATLAAAAWRDHPAIRAASLMCEVADQPPMIAGSAALLAAGLAAGRPAMAEAGLRILLSVALVTAAKAAVKAAVVRTRPNVVIEQGRYETGVWGPNDGPWNSFPSGHTGNAVAAARAAARVWPEATVPFALAAATAGGVQVPRGAHYPIDVAAGALLGLLAEAVVDRGLAAAERALARPGG
jgi:membrane-associated phospholipid phosphatase